MFFSQTQDEVLDHLTRWSDAQPEIHAVLLTSTRAIPDAIVDQFSDYDVILVVSDIAPWYADRAWLREFGDVLVDWWDPLQTDPITGTPSTGNVVHYADHPRIDFTLVTPAWLERLTERDALPPELDAGYRVLLDRTGLADRLPSATGRGYLADPPDEATYLALVNDFFVGVPTVAVNLVRGEFLPARWVLEIDMRDTYLRPMLTWRAQIDHDWQAPIGSLGKHLQRYLPPDLWEDLLSTWVGPSPDDAWQSLDAMIALFRRAAQEIGDHLGYAYPDALDQRVTAFAERIRSL